MSDAKLRGPKPVVIAGAIGFAIGFLHGLSVALQVDTNAPVIEGARGWFVGVFAMMALIVATGNVSDAPKGTSPLGHFLSWSITLQRILIGVPIALLITAILLSSTTVHSGVGYSLTSLVTLVLAACGAFVIQKSLLAMYEMYPRTPEARAELEQQKIEFYARLSGQRFARARKKLSEHGQGPLTLDELMQSADEPDENKRRAWATSRGFDPDQNEILVRETLERERKRREELLAEADAYVARGYRDPEETATASDPVDTIEEPSKLEKDSVLDESPARPTIGEVQQPGRPSYLDGYGRLRLPDELSGDGDLPPIK
jgi:hypothetical protein